MNQLPQQQADITQIAHYSILSCIGRGGMGLVYLARDTRLDRQVAIKCLRAELFEPHYRERFKREALLLAKLNHPHIVQIYDYVETDTQLALVMEYVNGQNLQQHLREHIVPITQRMQWLTQIAQGLAVAHDAGIIHRDLKTENILINQHKLAKISDLGIAKSQDFNATLTDHVTGSYASMSPEQAMGEAIDFRSDLFSFGILAYQLLCGAHPFGEAENKLQIMQRIISHPPISPTKNNPDLPPEAVELLGQLLSKNPDNRPAKTHWVAAQCEKLYQWFLANTKVDEDHTQALHNTSQSGIRTNPSRSNTQEHPTFETQILKKSAPLSMRIKAYLRNNITTLAVFSLIVVALAGALVWKLQPPKIDNDIAAKESTEPYSQAREFNKGIEALKLFDRPGSLEAAEKSFNTILAHTSDNAAAVAGLSLVYSHKYIGDNEDTIWIQKADASAQQSLKLNSQLALAHAALGQVFTLKSEHEKAFAAFEKALALEPTNIFAWRGKASAFRSAQRYDEAIQLTQQGLKQFPQERYFADMLGAIYIEQNNFAKAETAFRLSINLQPDAVNAYAGLYMVLQQQNRLDEAMQILQQGLQIRSSAPLHGNLGTALFNKGDYVGAAASFEDAVSPNKGNPNSHLAWANLADALLWIPGREAEAKKAYRKAIDLLTPLLERRKDDVTLISRKALYLARVGDSAQAKPLLVRVIALAPKNANVNFRAGLAYELLGERNSAVATLTQAVELGYPLKLIQAEPDLLELRRASGNF
ncbi:MAG: serine/threonine-protein kinase [Gammaproteobacteria bacterium]|nr:MAG: serine/threonine-protein kinase [Gammaproteobacteria bacterium]